MSDDHQWRQLGSVVNAVLMDARTKAIRRGALSKTPDSPLPQSAKRDGGLAPAKLGNGFLAGDGPAVSKPMQLELPFGIAPAPHGELAPRAPRGARLM
ncbi:MAG: hypothetical protein WAN43_15510 [Rhodomicrobium sp.]